jgi:hypothetical protein
MENGARTLVGSPSPGVTFLGGCLADGVSRSTAVRLEDAVVEEKRNPACMREVVVDKARSVLAAPRSRRGALTEREGADAIMMQSLLGEKKKPPHASVSYIEEAETWRGASLPLLPARGESAGVGHGREECCS